MELLRAEANNHTLKVELFGDFDARGSRDAQSQIDDIIHNDWHQEIEIDLRQVRRKSLIIVVALPLQHELLERLAAARNVQVQHHAARLEEPMGFPEYIRQRRFRRFVQHDVRDDQVKRRIAEAGRLRVPLTEVYRHAVRLGAGMCKS